jgi:hypothetical protein
MTPTEVRLRLFRFGYHPLPLNGKSPSIRPGWQNGFGLNEGEIELWGQTWPYATNTGVLARYTPCLDLDILNAAAAEAAEAFARQRFEECGNFLVRIGLPPKRAIVFRTDEPFKKINAPLIAPNETDPHRRNNQKIEFLANGQQFVAFGIHPDTHKPYAWHGGSPLEVPWQDLPLIRVAEAQGLVDELFALVTDPNNNFGYEPKNKKPTPAPGKGPISAKAPWGQYLNNLIDDDSNTAFAAALLRSGMSDGATVNFLTEAVRDHLTDEDEERKKRRLKNIPGQVASARRKIGEQGDPDETLESIRADCVEVTSIRWLWPGRFAFGKLGLITGLPDEGKGQLLWYIIATVTTGGSFPCGEGRAPIGNVIVLEAEDDLKDTVIPRLKAAGADLDRVHILNMVKINGKGDKRMFSLVTDLPKLRKKIEEIGNVALVVIDPLSAYLGRTKQVDTFRTTDVRNVLAPFTDLASELNVAIIAIMHFNKKVDVTNVLLRVSDSAAFTAAARHLYGVVDDCPNKRKLFVRGKNNVAAYDQKTLAYRFGLQMVGHDAKGEEIWAPHIIWESEPVDVTPSEAMSSTIGRPRDAREGAKEFLKKKLAYGPVKKDDIEDEAEANGISRSTLWRAKLEMRIGTDKDSNGEWIWFLPEAPPRPPRNDDD